MNKHRLKMNRVKVKPNSYFRERQRQRKIMKLLLPSYKEQIDLFD